MKEILTNIKLTLSYDGTNYHGFQRQKNALAIQEVIESCLSKIYNEEIRITASSRTDAGVHARWQTINYYPTFHNIPEKRIPYALNSVLPEDIRVLESEVVPIKFHSRYDAQSKVYSYTIDRGRFHSVFWRLYSYHMPFSLDIKAMQEGTQYLQGRHDLSSFCAAGSSVISKEREIKMAYWSEEGDLIRFYIEADGFLYNMIRIITGTLIEVGRQKIAPRRMLEILEARDRRLAGPTAPANGLCLEKVSY